MPGCLGTLRADAGQLPSAWQPAVVRSVRWKWARDGLVLFVVLSAWVPFMAASGKSPNITVASVITFEVLLALLCFGLTGALAIVRRRRSENQPSS